MREREREANGLVQVDLYCRAWVLGGLETEVCAGAYP